VFVLPFHGVRFFNYCTTKWIIGSIRII
jgi:hypothetical protein